MSDTVKTITFLERQITVKTPSGVQIAAWQRAADKFGEFGARENDELSDEEVDEFRGLLDKLFRIIVSLFKEQADKDWFEDQALEGNISDEDLLKMFTDATEGLKSDAEKGVPQKKAARRR